MRVTIDQVMAWRPCEEYSRERVTELFAGRETLGVAEIAELEIPIQDRVWAFCHEDLIPAPQLHEIACRIAEWLLEQERAAGHEPDQRSVEAIRVKRAWLRGEATDEELARARSSAWAAAFGNSALTAAAPGVAAAAAVPVAAMAAAVPAARLAAVPVAAAAWERCLEIICEIATA